MPSLVPCEKSIRYRVITSQSSHLDDKVQRLPTAVQYSNEYGNLIMVGSSLQVVRIAPNQPAIRGQTPPLRIITSTDIMSLRSFFSSCIFHNDDPFPSCLSERLPKSLSLHTSVVRPSSSFLSMKYRMPEAHSPSRRWPPSHIITGGIS